MAIIPSSRFTSAAQKSNSTSTCPAQQSLPPKEVERICKALIRLLDAPLTKQQGVQNDGKS